VGLGTKTGLLPKPVTGKQQNVVFPWKRTRTVHGAKRLALGSIKS